MTEFKDLCTKELKELIMTYDDLINGEISCYGTRDLRTYNGLLKEAERRGLKVNRQIVFK